MDEDVDPFVWKLIEMGAPKASDLKVVMCVCIIGFHELVMLLPPKVLICCVLLIIWSPLELTDVPRLT